jgi:hypothetical protein
MKSSILNAGPVRRGTVVSIAVLAAILSAHLGASPADARGSWLDAAKTELAGGSSLMNSIVHVPISSPRYSRDPGCIDCEYVGDHPEIDPINRYVYSIGEFDCEDGTGPHGPCLPCETFPGGFDCDFEGNVGVSEEYAGPEGDEFCENYWCDPIEALVESVIGLSETGRRTELTALLARHPGKLTLEGWPARLKTWGCSRDNEVVVSEPVRKVLEAALTAAARQLALAKRH